MNHCNYFTPNRATHSAFADALLEAEKSGVNIRALNCIVATDELIIDKSVEIRL